MRRHHRAVSNHDAWEDTEGKLAKIEPGSEGYRPARMQYSAGTPCASTRSRSSMTSIVADRLCGSMPITTRLMAAAPHWQTMDIDREGKATLSCANPSRATPRPVAGGRTPDESHTHVGVDSRRIEQPASHLDPAWPGTGRRSN